MVNEIAKWKKFDSLKDNLTSDGLGYHYWIVKEV